MSKGDGKVEMIVGHENGKVFVRLKKRMDVIIFDPENCVDVARALTDHAFECSTGLKPVGDSLKAEIVERHRVTLTTRIALVLNSSRENKTIANGKLAQQLVEICLSEIF